MIELKNQSGMSFRAIARESGYSESYVRKMAKEVGIKSTYLREKKSHFVAYDGEAISDCYCLLADSSGDYIYEKTGLSTIACLDFLMQARQGVRIFFGMHYDVNQIVKDFDLETRKKFFKGLDVTYGRYTLRYYTKKRLEINDKKSRRRAVFFDVLGFFQGGFETVVQTILHEEHDLLTIGKYFRDRFDELELKTIIAYNALECELLLRVMDKVREAVTFNLGELHVSIKAWHGAGAVASALLKQIPAVKINQKRENQFNSPLREGIARAYFGGRIELLKLGCFENIYAYDVNSAYPSACQHLFNLVNPVYKKGGDMTDRLSTLYHVKWFIRNPEMFRYPAPFPWRSKNGYVTFPGCGEGWYWHPEVSAAREAFGNDIEIVESYAFPFLRTSIGGIIQKAYILRRQYKERGDGRELGIKLSLNSLYGKFAQTRGRGEYRVLSWAGFITSFTRAQLLRAAMQAPDAIIGFATDSIYSLKPLDLPVSKMLGDWSLTHYDAGRFIMPGLVQLVENGKITGRTRGIHVQPQKLKIAFNEDIHALATTIREQRTEDTIDWCDIFNQLKDHGTATVYTSLFITHSLADANPNAYGPHRLKILTGANGFTKTIDPYQQTKRNYELPALSHRKKYFDFAKQSCDSTMTFQLRDEGSIVCSYLPSAFKADYDEMLVNNKSED